MRKFILQIEAIARWRTALNYHLCWWKLHFLSCALPTGFSIFCKLHICHTIYYMTVLLFPRFRQFFSWKRQHFFPLLKNGLEQINTHSSIWLPSVPPSWFEEEPRSTHNTYIKRIIHILEPFSWGRDRATEIPTVRTVNTFYIGSIPPCVQLPYQPTRHLCLYYLSSISNTFEKHNSQLPNLWGNIFTIKSFCILP